MTDNGSSFRSFRYARALRRLRIKPHSRFIAQAGLELDAAGRERPGYRLERLDADRNTDHAVRPLGL
jgi:transposase InsO family protein